MSGDSESRELFESLCRRLGIRCERIPESEKPTPDYNIFPCGEQVACEIKQINPNEKDKEYERDMREGRGGSYHFSGNIGDRVRNKINKAAPQLQESSREGYPTLLVLYNNTGVSVHTEWYHIKIAMYGYDTVIMGVPQDPSRSPYTKDRKSGESKKMTPEHNTSISAIGVIEPHDDMIKFIVYHNVHARNPLSPSLIQGEGVTHLTLREERPGEFDEWQIVTAEG